MKVLYLLQGSPTESGRAVARRRTSDFLPKLDASIDVELTVRTLISKGDLHEHLINIGLRAGTIAGDPWLRIPSGILRLAKLLREQDFDIIHASESIPTNVAGIARRISRTKSAVAYSRFHEYGSRRLQLSSRMAGRLSDVTFVQSHAVAARAVELDGTDPDAIRIVRSGVADTRHVATSEVQEVRRSLAIPPDAPIVGTVARIRPEKGLEHLIDAMVGLSDLEPLPHLVIAGDGSHLDEVRRRAIDALGSRAHVVGHQDDISLWFNVADVVAMPSLRDAFPLAAIEAMACDRPIVASAVGGLIEAVGNDGVALLCPPGDPSALAAALRPLLQDPMLRRSMGMAARKRYEQNFTLDHMAESMADAWRWAIERSRIA